LSGQFILFYFLIFVYSIFFHVRVVRPTRCGAHDRGVADAEPDTDKENGSAPEAGGGGGAMVAGGGGALAGDYHDHFVRSDEARGPAPQSGQRKITHVPASSRSDDQYEFVPERFVFV
jgi:hypothetical protein